MANPYITPALFKFFRELATNNDREWFQAHKERYEAKVREPLLQFVRDFEPELHQISPNFVADARRTGGSLFRLHRDVRFSNDKSPYKTAAGIHFRHNSGRDVHGPGYYLHLEPGNLFAGAGIWHPETKTLVLLRNFIAEKSEGWLQAVTDPEFTAHFTLNGERLKRPPRGFDPNHPFIEDLKRKDFIGVSALTQRDVCADDFLERFTARCRAAAPFMEYLTMAVGLSW